MGHRRLQCTSALRAPMELPADRMHCPRYRESHASESAQVYGSRVMYACVGLERRRGAQFTARFRASWMSDFCFFPVVAPSEIAGPEPPALISESGCEIERGTARRISIARFLRHHTLL